MVLNASGTSHYSLEELVKYSHIPEDLRNLLFEALDTIRLHDLEVERLERQLEIKDEQISFASNAIEGIYKAIKDTTKHKDLVKEIHEAIECSLFEGG
jgi:hypothetical protein